MHLLWSPHHLGEIANLESVQRLFTKRLVGLRNMTFADRINFFKLDRLEERRLRFAVIFTYKILFGHVNMNCSDRSINQSINQSINKSEFCKVAA